MEQPRSWNTFMEEFNHKPTNVDKVKELEKHFEFHKLKYRLKPYTGNKKGIYCNVIIVLCPDCDLELSVNNLSWRTTNKKLKGTKTTKSQGLNGLISSAKDRWKLYNNETAESMYQKKLDKLYNKKTKANVLYKLTQAEMYSKEGYSLSKACKLAGADYKTFKLYLDGNYNVDY